MAASTAKALRPIIVWFRNDLRVRDHAALTAAAESGAPVLALYVLDDATPGQWARASASRWWLHHSLAEQAAALEKLGLKLILRRGPALDVVAEVADEVGAGAVYCSRCYEPWARSLESALKTKLADRGVDLKRFAGALLHEPDQLKTQAGGPFKVYSPFWRALSATVRVDAALAAPVRLLTYTGKIKSARLEDFELLPRRPDWAGGMRQAWRPGEAAAHQRLSEFLKRALKSYSDDRNRPDLPGTSGLSPYLHFGEISPRQCWQAARSFGAKGGVDKGLETFLKELVWREFSYHLLFHFPDLPEKPFRPEFARFPWSKDPAALKAWQRGRTGYPIVDAGMRELWATGWMHNRVRMIVASFLIKDLLIPWQDGEAWFWDTLVDADLANNAASWQWVAGSGADAAPYFRIFNPVSQAAKFDPEGSYVRRWVPELARLPAPVIHAPWEAPPLLLSEAGVVLGKTYPHRLVDHDKCRHAALAAYEEIKVRSAVEA